MNKILETAQHWTEAGFTILPIAYRSKKAMVDWLEYQERLPSYTELYQWFYSPFMNLGLIVGHGLVVIDFDIQDVFDYWLPGFLMRYPQSTYMVKTRRGMHVYIHTEQLAKNYHNLLLDIKAERGYVLVPPSIHPSGFEYWVWQDKPILRVEQLEDVLPNWYIPEPEKVECVSQVQSQYICCDDPWEEADMATEGFSVAQIRAKISILDLLPDIEPSSREGWYVAKCPFHEDTHASFWIDARRGLCGCWKCNIKEMDVINLYARLHGLSNGEAIRVMSERDGSVGRIGGIND